MKFDSHESVNDLVDKAFEIIQDSLENGAPMERLDTALRFTQFIAIGSFTKRIERLETWQSVLMEKEKKEEKEK